MKTLAFTMTLLLAAAGAQAQTVWRCGPDGRSYSDSPCPAGRTVAVADGRSDDEVLAARDVALRERALADDLTQQRQVRERLPPGAGLAGIRHERPAEAVKPKRSLAKKQRPAAPGTWPTAVRVSPRTTG